MNVISDWNGGSFTYVLSFSSLIGLLVPLLWLIANACNALLTVPTNLFILYERMVLLINP